MKVLFIHTGGTISMRKGASGFAPVEGLVEEAVRARLHDADLAVYVVDPLIDSAEITSQDWNAILDVIDAHPEHQVLLTHGTDTMSYTGAALATALAGTNRRVVMTGSMKPLGLGGDAESNLDLAISALEGAGVVLAFGGKVMPAHGVMKSDSNIDAAFSFNESPSPIAPKFKRFHDKDLAILTLAPDLPPRALAGALDALDGAVLRVYGSGTTTSNPEFLKVIAKAVDAGKTIRCVSQCAVGGLNPGNYEAGSKFWETGVQNGGAETPEAALIHLWLNA